MTAKDKILRLRLPPRPPHRAQHQRSAGSPETRGSLLRSGWQQWEQGIRRRHGLAAKSNKKSPAVPSGGRWAIGSSGHRVIGWSGEVNSQRSSNQHSALSIRLRRRLVLSPKGGIPVAHRRTARVREGIQIWF